MITKRSIVQHIGVTPPGIVEVKLSLQLLEDGNLMAVPLVHRVSLQPGADTAAALDGLNANLTAMKHNPVSAEDWQRVESVCAATWTADTLAKWSAAQAARAAQLAAESGANKDP